MKIDKVYDKFFYGKKLKMTSGMGSEYVSNLLLLINDDSIVLDTRINDNDRIEKLVRMLSHASRIKAIPESRSIWLLKKSLDTDLTIAFEKSFTFGTLTTHCTTETTSFVYRITARIRQSLPSKPSGIGIELIHTLLYICLELGIIDYPLDVLFDAADFFGKDMESYLEQDPYMTERQDHHFTLYQQKCKT